MHPDRSTVIPESDTFTDAWSAHHGFLGDLAYRLLGSYGEAEDVVQEAFVRLLRADPDSIHDVRAWLVVVVSRLCLDLLRSARARREAYLGPRLPEPLLGDDGGNDPARIVTLDESVRMALLVVMERMSPAERVVFVLHDVFEFPFERIAAIVGRSPAACRQLASRARRRVREEAGATRFETSPEEQRRVIDAFIAACSAGDVEALLPLLDPVVAGWADLGGIAAAVQSVGREAVARRVMQFFGGSTGTSLVSSRVNGEPGIVALRSGSVIAVISLTILGGAITRIFTVVDPEKLTGARRVLEMEPG
jgi:RNA polymerase sigma-70 factor (ECF subfamily)